MSRFQSQSMFLENMILTGPWPELVVMWHCQGHGGGSSPTLQFMVKVALPGPLAGELKKL